MLVLKSDYERVALGGLLHDIGKVLNRCDSYLKKVEKGNHPYLSEWFINYLDEKGVLKFDEKLKEIVKKHHENTGMDTEINVSSIKDDVELKKLALIVARADNYSSMERDEDEKRNDYKTKQLNSIFSRVDIGNGSVDKEAYRLRELDEKNIFSETETKNSQEELSNLIESFLKEIEKIKTEDFTTFYNRIMELLKKYLWCIPSDTQKEIADISLYDHLKTTSAIAVASYNYHCEDSLIFSKVTQVAIKDGKKSQHFLLIGGDISGIQNYIYSLKKSEKIAKRLRGRSFFIKLLSQLASYRVIEELNLTQSNIVISNSGKFFIVAQNTDETIKKLERLREQINTELYSEYEAELFLNLQWIGLKGEELGVKFSEKYRELIQKLELTKGKIFEDEIKRTPIFENELYGNSEKVELCKICGKFLKLKSENGGCERCNLDEEIGGKLPKLKRIAIYKSEKMRGKICCFGYRIELLSDKETIEETPYLVVDYKGDLDGDYPVITDYYGGFIPMKDGEIMTFSEIAKESTVENLGVLKGDVDNLGLIMNLGLQIEIEIEKESDSDGETYRNVTSISRVATISRMLDMFFSNWIPAQLKSEQKSLGSHYIVYSGGDDFMIVGAWDKLLKFGKIIQENFKEYVGNNPNFTISMGLALSKANEPIYYSSEKAKELESLVKESGKNGIALFNSYIPWNRYKEVFELGDYLIDLMNEELISQSFIYRLLEYTGLAEEYLKDRSRSKNLIYISNFEYDVKRNIIDRLKKDGKEEKAKEIYRKLAKYFTYSGIVDERTKEFLSKYMRVSLNYAVRMKRRSK